MRILALLFGLFLTVTGILMIGAYLVGVVDIFIDQPPDRSWLFWGIPIATIGATALLGGVGLLILWRHLGKPEKESSSAS